MEECKSKNESEVQKEIFHDIRRNTRSLTLNALKNISHVNTTVNTSNISKDEKKVHTQEPLENQMEPAIDTKEGISTLLEVKSKNQQDNTIRKNVLRSSEPFRRRYGRKQKKKVEKSVYPTTSTNKKDVLNSTKLKPGRTPLKRVLRITRSMQYLENNIVEKRLRDESSIRQLKILSLERQTAYKLRLKHPVDTLPVQESVEGAVKNMPLLPRSKHVSPMKCLCCDAANKPQLKKTERTQIDLPRKPKKGRPRKYSLPQEDTNSQATIQTNLEIKKELIVKTETDPLMLSVKQENDPSNDPVRTESSYKKKKRKVEKRQTKKVIRKRTAAQQLTRNRQNNVRRIITNYKCIKAKVGEKSFKKELKTIKEENCQTEDVKPDKDSCIHSNGKFPEFSQLIHEMYNENSKGLSIPLIRIEDLPLSELLQLIVRPQYVENRELFPKKMQSMEGYSDTKYEDIDIKKDKDSDEGSSCPQLLSENDAQSTTKEMQDNSSNCNIDVNFDSNNKISTQNTVDSSEDDEQTNEILHRLASLTLSSCEKQNDLQADGKPLLTQMDLYKKDRKSFFIWKQWILNNNLQVQYISVLEKQRKIHNMNVITESDGIVKNSEFSPIQHLKLLGDKYDASTDKTGITHPLNGPLPCISETNGYTNITETSKETTCKENILNPNNSNSNLIIGRESNSENVKHVVQREQVLSESESKININSQAHTDDSNKGIKRRSSDNLDVNIKKKSRTISCDRTQYAADNKEKENLPLDFDVDIHTKKDSNEKDVMFTLETVVQCCLCDKKFSSQRSLDEHMFFIHDVALNSSVVSDLLTPCINRREKSESNSDLPTCEEKETLGPQSDENIEETNDVLEEEGGEEEEGEGEGEEEEEEEKEGDEEEEEEEIKDEMSYSEWEKSHNIIGKNKKWRCKICRENFALIRNYLRHKYYSHNDESVVHICDNCNKVLTSVAMVNIHMCANVNSWRCRRCNVNFSNAISLTRHNMNCHLESIGPHVCDLCKSSFLTKYMLQRHKSVHYRISNNVNNFLPFSPFVIDNNVFKNPNNKLSFNRSKVEKQRSPLNGISSSIPNTNDKLSNGVEQLYSKQFIYFPTSRGHLSETYKPLNDVHLSCSGEEQFKCKICDAIFLTLPRIKFHLKKQHNIEVDICKLCTDLYVTDSIARHMMNRHIVSDYNYLKESQNEKCNTVEDSENDLVKFLGFKRLLSLYEYQKFNDISENQIFYCTVCSKELLGLRSYKIHHLESHDVICILCNIEFDCSSQAFEHKHKVHFSIDSYLWAIHEIIASILKLKKYGNSIKDTILKLNEVTASNAWQVIDKKQDEYIEKESAAVDTEIVETSLTQDFDVATEECNIPCMSDQEESTVELPYSGDTSLTCVNNEKLQTNSLDLLNNDVNNTDNRYTYLSHTLDSTDVSANSVNDEQQISNQDNVLIILEDALQTYQGNVKDLVVLTFSPCKVFREDQVTNVLTEYGKNINS